MANKVLFKTGTAAGFGNLTTKKAGQIYFVPQTDNSPLSGEIYFDYDANTRLIMGNTTGSLNDTTNKLYLIGSTSQQTASYTSSNSGVYMTNGTLTATAFNGAWKNTQYDLGASDKPIYIASGTFTASTSSIGDANTPVYMSNGVITSTGKSFANYLALAGGTMTGNVNFGNTNNGFSNGLYFQVGNNDGARVVAGATAKDAGYLEIATTNDGTEPIYVRQYNNGTKWNDYVSIARTATLLDASGNTTFPGTVNAIGVNTTGSIVVGGNVTATKFIGQLDGPADSVAHAITFGDSTNPLYTYDGSTAVNIPLYNGETL